MTSRSLAVSILAALASCGDNSIPPDSSVPVDSGPPPEARILTWEDAERVWADGWCQYAFRCYPDDFPEYYDDHQDCVDTEVAYLCSLPRRYACEEGYFRIRYQALAECYLAIRDIDCSATELPQPCVEAFSSASDA